MKNNYDLLAKLKEQAKFANLVQNGICECCGETNPYALRIFEDHHTSTVGFSPESSVLCLNCHAVVTQLQNRIPSNLRSKKLDLEYRIPFILLTHSAMRSRMAEKELELLNQFFLEADRWKK